MQQIYTPFLIFISLFFSTEASTQWFTEVSTTVGIDQVVEHQLKLGGGAAFFDFDNDRDDDLYITGGQGRDQLFENNGDGTFTDISFSAGIGLTGQFFTAGVVTADVDNDGFRDILVTTGRDLFSSYAPNLLLMNNGDGTFSERSQVAGLLEKSNSFSATFFDYDQDADLDLYVVNYVESTAFLRDTLEDGRVVNVGYDHDCFDNFFYRNNGDGTFVEVSAELGLTDTGCGLAVAATDYDLDGDIDLMVVNDFGEFIEPNALFENQYPLDTFINVATATRADLQIYGMGIAQGDYDLDGDFDYYITNIGENSLLENQGAAGFTDVAETAGVMNTWVQEPFTLTTSWGTTFADFNNDTYPDLFVANGQIEALSFNQTGRHDPNKFYLNNGDKTFTDLTETAGIGSDTRARGMAQADYDSDGDMDMIVMVLDIIQENNTDPRTLFYQNNIPATNHWLQVRLEGVECHRDAYGSMVRVFVEDKVLMQELVCGTSHLSQHSSALHFGLGMAEQVDSIEIRWLGGESEWIYEVEVDQQVYYKQGEAGVAPPEPVAVNFKVDMQQAEVSINGVYLAGDFVNESGNVQLEALTENIYGTTLSLLPGTYPYRFVNGSTLFPDSYEMLAETDSCASMNDGTVYRTLEVTAERTNYDLAAVCFNSCDTCRLVDNVADIKNVAPLFYLHPNLTQTMTQIQFAANNYAPKSIVVTNIQGQKIMEKTTTQTTTELLVSDWAAGIYLVRIQFESGQVQTQKLVVNN